MTCKCGQESGDFTFAGSDGYGRSYYHSTEECRFEDARTLWMRVFNPLAQFCERLAGKPSRCPRVRVVREPSRLVADILDEIRALDASRKESGR